MFLRYRTLQNMIVTWFDWTSIDMLSHFYLPLQSNYIRLKYVFSSFEFKTLSFSILPF